MGIEGMERMARDWRYEKFADSILTSQNIWMLTIVPEQSPAFPEKVNIVTVGEMMSVAGRGEPSVKQ